MKSNNYYIEAEEIGKLFNRSTNYGYKLKYLRQSKNYTMDDLLKLMNPTYNLSVSRGMISRWENNKA